MKISQMISRLMANAALLSLLSFPSGVQAQASLAEQKTQAEIEQIELNKQKTLADMISSSRTTSAGSATVTGLEQSAEGLMLSRVVQEQTARAIVSQLGTPSGPVSVVFGDQPVSTAEYLAVRHGSTALEANLERAAALARDYYGRPDASRGSKPIGLQPYAAVTAAIPLALTAVTTVASLLKVNTSVTGIALATPNEQYKAVLLQHLRRYHWTIDPPRAIVSSTRYADDLFKTMKPAKDEAAKYFSKYVAHLAQKDGKPASLPEGEVIVGKALETALNDHATLEKAMFTPVNGVLPATVIEEQKLLVDSAATRRILYIQHHKAALTSITKQGAFTGIFSVPAYVSASHVVEFAMSGPDGGVFNTVRYDTPIMRVTGVRKWLAAMEPADENKVSNAAGRTATRK